MARGKTSVYYIDNKRFYQEMKAYLELCKEAEETADEYPIIPNYIGECFYKIATKLATRPNFSSYTYKEEMIGDAIENCIHYVKSFNPEKSLNPFAYFTQVAWNSFVTRINKEKKQQYVKYKSMEYMIVNNSNFSSQVSDIGHIITPEFHENTQKFISSFEENIEKSKRKKEEKKEERKALENFIEEE
jgi:DNA-directed RNA polymerase specialized sigma24 family protein